MTQDQAASGGTPIREHAGLPVKGYKPQTVEKVAAVNKNKVMEEESLRLLDLMATDPEVDKRWLAIGRTHLEQAWMAINRSIFKPDRLELVPPAQHTDIRA